MTDYARFLAGDHGDMGDHDHDHGHSHGDGEHAHVHGKGVSNFKTGILILYLVITFLGSLPILIPKCRNSSAILSVMNCFAGGVFIAIALIHLLPEAGDQWNGWAIEN